jgi:hypothetical protein
MNRRMTPTDHYQAEFTYPQRVGAGAGYAGTYNGTACNAATTFNVSDSINDRHHVMQFTDGATDAIFIQYSIDRRYVPNSSIYVDVYWTTPSSTSGNGFIEVGLAQKGADGLIGDDTDTEFIAFAAYAGPTSTNQVIKSTFTFDGSLHGGVTGGDSLSFIFMRQGGHASDTLSDNLLITGFVWRYNINKL